MQKLNAVFTKQFRKSLKKYQNNKKVLCELDIVLELLLYKKTIPAKYRNHMLTGNFKGMYELHLKPDDLLIYFIKQEEDLILVDIGSHSNLFKK